VFLRVKAIGNAPIMRQNLYQINSSRKFESVIQFLRKRMGCKPDEPLVSTLEVHF
ncbi:hypothetical protein WOLCODRAFT_51763, partial [Wolfiporia cocos MD-104 SS10]